MKSNKYQEKGNNDVSQDTGHAPVNTASNAIVCLWFQGTLLAQAQLVAHQDPQGLFHSPILQLASPSLDCYKIFCSKWGTSH